MTPEEHWKRHQELYKSLKELVYDYMQHRPLETMYAHLDHEMTVMELLHWTGEMAEYPTHKAPQNDI